jgi:hypothetical protein
MLVRSGTFSTSDQASLDELNKLAWEQAKVTDTASGDTISVKSVAAAQVVVGNGGFQSRQIDHRYRQLEMA